MSFKTTLLAAIAAVSIALPALADGIEVHDAYAIQATPMSPSGAAFMEIHNHGGPDDRLIDVRADVAERVELHTHIQNADGVMQMVHVEEGFDLPTDGEISLARGGNHVMFIGLKAPLEDGAVFPLTLVFEKAGEVVVDVSVDLVRMTEDMGAMEHGAMEHGAMDHGAMDHGAMDHGAEAAPSAN